MKYGHIILTLTLLLSGCALDELFNNHDQYRCALKYRLSSSTGDSSLLDEEHALKYGVDCDTLYVNKSNQSFSAYCEYYSRTITVESSDMPGAVTKCRDYAQDLDWVIPEFTSCDCVIDN